MRPCKVIKYNNVCWNVFNKNELNLLIWLVNISFFMYFCYICNELCT